MEDDAHKMFEVTIVGMRFYDSDATDAGSYATYFLVPEPTNKYDENAVLVYGVVNNMHKKLGHVSRSTQHNLPFINEDGIAYKRVYANRDSEFATTITLIDNE